MRTLQHPDVNSVELATVLAALADPIRLDVLRQLTVVDDIVCGEFEILSQVSISTLSHHLKVLRESGIIRITPDGRYRRHTLRRAELDSRFPGLLDAITDAVRSGQRRVSHR